MSIPKFPLLHFKNFENNRYRNKWSVGGQRVVISFIFIPKSDRSRRIKHDFKIFNLFPEFRKFLWWLVAKYKIETQ